MRRERSELHVSVHGPGADIDTAVEVGQATKRLLKAVADEMGIEGVEWKIDRIEFRCDGCDLRRPDRPRPNEGWSHDDGSDYCPGCSAARSGTPE